MVESAGYIYRSVQVSVPDTGCNVPYDIRGVRGQIRYQKKQNKKNINRSVLLISDTCGQRETSGRIDVVSTIESKGRIYMKLRVSEDA